MEKEQSKKNKRAFEVLGSFLSTIMGVPPGLGGADCNSSFLGGNEGGKKGC